jgi:hypothetical protein
VLLQHTEIEQLLYTYYAREPALRRRDDACEVLAPFVPLDDAAVRGPDRRSIVVRASAHGGRSLGRCGFAH